MGRDIIRQDQYGRLAITHEIAGHGIHEVRVGVIHLGQKFVDRLHLDVGPLLDEFRIVIYNSQMVEVRRTRAFEDWFRGLRDLQAIARIQTRIDRLELGNPGDVKPRPVARCSPRSPAATVCLA